MWFCQFQALSWPTGCCCYCEHEHALKHSAFKVLMQALHCGECQRPITRQKHDAGPTSLGKVAPNRMHASIRSDHPIDCMPAHCMIAHTCKSLTRLTFFCSNFLVVARGKLPVAPKPVSRPCTRASVDCPAAAGESGWSINAAITLSQRRKV